MTIYDEIKAEREYQDKRWGHELDDKYNTPWMWVAYITLYATKWMTGTFTPLEGAVVDKFRRVMIQVAALAVAAVESLDRQRAGPERRAFYEHGDR